MGRNSRLTNFIPKKQEIGRAPSVWTDGRGRTTKMSHAAEQSEAPRKPAMENQPADAALAPSCGSAATTAEKVGILALHFVMYSMVWWYDKRLLVAWLCYGIVQEWQSDIRKRKQQND